MAWRENISHIIVESDLNIIIDMITDKFRFSGQIPSLVRQSRKLLSLRWQVLIGHTWHERNRSGDWFFKLVDP